MCIWEYGEIYSTYNVYMLVFKICINCVVYIYMVKLKTNVYFVDSKGFISLFILGNCFHWVLFNTVYHESWQKMQNKACLVGMSEYIF